MNSVHHWPAEVKNADLSFAAFFHVFMGVLCFVYLVCSLRTNVVFVCIFATLVPAFGCLAGAFWQTANGNVALAGKLQIAAGAITFVTDMLGWWIFFAIMLAALDFPFQIPGKQFLVRRVPRWLIMG